jgi:hypothetical protein
VFTNHQEHLTVFTASGNIDQCRCWLRSNPAMTPAGSDIGEYYQVL